MTTEVSNRCGANVLWPEVCDDAHLRISNTPLNMGLGAQSRTGEQGITFQKRGTDCVEGRQVQVLAQLMKEVENRTIQMAFHKVPGFSSAVAFGEFAGLGDESVLNEKLPGFSSFNHLIDKLPHHPSLFLEAGFLGLFAEGRGRAHGGRIGAGLLERKQEQSAGSVE